MDSHCDKNSGHEKIIPQKKIRRLSISDHKSFLLPKKYWSKKRYADVNRKLNGKKLFFIFTCSQENNNLIIITMSDICGKV